MSIAQHPNANSLGKSTDFGLPSHFNVNNPSGGKLPSPVSSKPASPRSSPSPSVSCSKAGSLASSRADLVKSLDSSSTMKSSSKPKKEKKVQPPAPAETRCMARVATGGQCKRSRNEGSDLCTCHSKNLPYNRINEPLPVKFLNLPKKRGPRFRNQSTFEMSAEIQHHYVATQLIKIDESLYLIDELGLLYSNDKRGEIVGRRLKNEIHWYSS